MREGLWINVGCGLYPADGWLNLDVDQTQARPDRLVSVDDPFPFDDASVEKAYLGHVLEHVPLEDLPCFLADLRRVLQPGGQLLVVGPDTIRVLNRWRDGQEPWERVWATLEGPDPYDAPAEAAWEGQQHRWNCYEARVIHMLTRAGFEDVHPLPITGDALAGWPVVDHAQDQCAVAGMIPMEDT